MRFHRAISCFAVAVLISLPGGAAQATAVSALPDESGPTALESGGIGCFDPYAWVWRAPRAERVALPIDGTAACEIGRPGCSRRPESIVEERAVDEAAHVCALKLAQYSKGERTDEFDRDSCLESERAVLSIDVEPLHPADPDPWSALACRESDPECHSMPPIPEPHRPIPTTSAAVLTLGLDLDRGLDRPSRPGRADGPRQGVRRRVERPPAANPV